MDPDHGESTARTEDIAFIIPQAEGNQNMLRVWGGGVYEDEALYEYVRFVALIVFCVADLRQCV